MGFKKNNPGCQCCGDGGGAGDCVHCSGTPPSTISVTIDGYQNCAAPYDYCDQCASVDGTYVLEWISYISNICTWMYQDLDWLCDTGDTGKLTITAEVRLIGGNVHWYIYCNIQNESGTAFSTAYWYWNSGSSDAMDCTATRTLTYNATDGGNPACCQEPGGATCQVN